jgi:hypothetical protein
MRYFTSSLVFASGIGLIALGLVLILVFQLHYGSEPLRVEIVFTLIGLGVPIALQGMTLMLGYRKYSRITGIIGFALCLIALVLFVVLYPKDWYYPNVSFVATTYALGLIMVLGGLFAEIVQNIIERRQVEKPKWQAVEEPEIKDEKFLEPVKVPELEFELSIKDVKEDVKFGRALESGRVGKIVKVKDDINYQAETLNRVQHGKLEVKVKDDEIADISKTLKAIESKMTKKKGLFK